MSTQTPITQYFKLGKQVVMEKKPKKRKLSLVRVPNETIEVLSSDEENQKQVVSPRPVTLSQGSEKGNASESSSETIIYPLSPKTPKDNITPLKSVNSPSKNTPSSSKKFYSPNKKRSVTKKSVNNTARNLMSEFSPVRRLIKFEEDEPYAKACEGQDDKTKFLLKIVNDFLKDESLKPFLNGNEVDLLAKYLTMSKVALKLVCRLYWRKDIWYKREQLIDICTGKEESLDDPSIHTMLETLVAYQFLVPGTHQNISYEEFTSILKAVELKEICKQLKIKTQSKKGAVESLKEFCRKASISTFFNGNNATSNKNRVMKIMSEKAGKCYRVSGIVRGTLDRLYLLTYLGIDFDVLREKRLELMLLNEKIERETFPVDENMELDNASIVFADKDDFERYFFAHNIYEDYLTRTDCEEKCNITRQVFDLYKNIDADHFIRYQNLYPWLQRFTPPSVYIKIMLSGIVELKKGKSIEKCQLAVEILSTLIEQKFRQHRKAEWYAEKALILSSYLNKPHEAAQVLLDGFESNLSEEEKDVMRPRANKIARQKNVTLEESVRSALLAYAAKEEILECNIPCQHLYKQPMENPSKGKAMYESRAEGGRVLQGVEQYALSCLLQQEDCTAGGHWEGRLITSMFFILFWDAIYSKPRNAPGVFLTRYQKYPLDMFSPHFYENRRDSIDARLAILEECSGDEVAELINIELDIRPESELSGVHRDIPASDLVSVARCLGGVRAAAICRRLAHDFRYAHSGFPDLTVWHDFDKKIKFVEVKSDSDKPSMKQIQWLQYLLQHGIEAEFCYVGAHTDRPKARNKIAN